MCYYGNFKICKQIYLLKSYENRKVLANLKTDSDKNLPLPEIQPLTQNTVILVIYYFSFLSSQVKRN